MDKSILETVHESMQDMHDAGVVDKQTMRKFDALCLPKVTEYSAAQIKKIRLNNNLSQPVFAAYLNTAVETVRKWEAGAHTRKRPNGAAMKLISMVDTYGIEILGTPDWRAECEGLIEAESASVDVTAPGKVRRGHIPGKAKVASKAKAAVVV